MRIAIDFQSLLVAAIVALMLIFLEFARRRARARLGCALERWRAALANQRDRPASMYA